jgi:WD40 repeat protein
LSNLAVVTSIMFSPDGRRLAAGTCEQRQIGDNSFDTDFRNGELKVWDAKNGKDLKTLHVQAGGVLGVAFSLDDSRVVASCGRRFASGGHSGFTFDFNLEILIPAEIIVWDLPSGREIVTLRGHADDVIGSPGRLPLRAPTPPYMRVRIRRFLAVLAD